MKLRVLLKLNELNIYQDARSVDSETLLVS